MKCLSTYMILNRSYKYLDNSIYHQVTQNNNKRIVFCFFYRGERYTDLQSQKQTYICNNNKTRFFPTIAHPVQLFTLPPLFVVVVVVCLLFVNERFWLLCFFFLFFLLFFFLFFFFCFAFFLHYSIGNYYSFRYH